MIPSNSRIRRICAALAALFGGLYVAALLNYNFRFYLKGFLSILDYGRSFQQLYLFLIWGAGCFLALAFCRDQPKRTTNTAHWALGSVLLLHAINAVSFLTYSALTTTPLGERSISVDQAASSVTSITHIHTLKAVMATGLETLGISSGQIDGDCGAAFLHLLPPWFWQMGLAVSLTTLFLLVAVLRERFRHWPEGERWECLALYLVASFTALKTALDGGSFNPSAMSALTVLIGLLYYPATDRPLARKSITPPYLIRFLPYLLLLPIVAIMIPQTPDMERLDLTLSFVLELSRCFAFLLLIVYGVRTILHRSFRALAGALICAAILYTYRNANPWYNDELVPLSIRAEAGDTLYILRRNGVPNPATIATQGKLMLDRVRIAEAMPVQDLYSAYGLRSGIHSFAIEGRSCRPEQEVTVSGELRTIQGDIPLAPTSSELIRSIHVDSCTEAEWCTRRFIASLKGCVPIENGAQYALLQHFVQQGARRFIYRGERVWNKQGLAQ